MSRGRGCQVRRQRPDCQLGPDLAELTTRLGLVVLDHLLCRQVRLVAHQQLVDALDGISVNLLQPLLDVCKGVWGSAPVGRKRTVRLTPVRHVVHYNDTVCSAVIRRGDGPETFLASSVPLYTRRQHIDKRRRGPKGEEGERGYRTDRCRSWITVFFRRKVKREGPKGSEMRGPAKAKTTVTGRSGRDGALRKRQPSARSKAHDRREAVGHQDDEIASRKKSPKEEKDIERGRKNEARARECPSRGGCPKIEMCEAW